MALYFYLDHTMGGVDRRTGPQKMHAYHVTYLCVQECYFIMLCMCELLRFSETPVSVIALTQCESRGGC